MRQLIIPAVLAFAALAATTTAGAGGNSAFDTKSSGVISIAVYGDSPYGTSPTDASQTDATPAFIDNINSDPSISLVLHVGDIHSGSQFCTEAYDEQIYGLWMAFRAPLVYTPGDNEWTDCHKTGEGGGKYNGVTGTIDYTNPGSDQHGDPAYHLSLVRQIFFANPGYALADRKLLLSQSQVRPPAAHPSNAEYVENVMWEQSKVLFVTLNIPGGSNNDTDIWYGTPTMSDAQRQERQKRTDADLDWLNAAFAKAKTDGVVAVVIQTQADMWDLDGKASSHIKEYLKFIDQIAALTKQFGKPVLLLNGDSHVYRSDNPLVSGAPCVTEAALGDGVVPCADDAYTNQAPNLAAGVSFATGGSLPAGTSYNVPNFHRLVVHGKSSPMQWIKLTVNPRASVTPATPNAFGPFSWQRVIPQ